MVARSAKESRVRGTEAASLVLALASARTATLGSGRLVCVDGPAGSGKTTFAASLARSVGAQVVHADDLMDGWRGLAAVARQLTALLGPLAAGLPGSYRHYDWEQGRYDRTVEVPPAPWLVVEGVGAGAAAIAPYVTVLVWVEVDDELRLARGLERDGVGMEAHWRQFMVDERALFARDGTRERADVLVDGTGRTPPVVR
jgi:uridine kinase